jgi:hypothetical protein
VFLSFDPVSDTLEVSDTYVIYCIKVKPRPGGPGLVGVNLCNHGRNALMMNSELNPVSDTLEVSDTCLILALSPTARKISI